MGVCVCVSCEADLCLHKSWNRSSHNSDHPLPSPLPAFTPRPCHPLSGTGKGSIFFLIVLDSSKVVPVLVNNISLPPLARLPRPWHPGIRLHLGWNHWKCDWEYEWLSAGGLPIRLVDECIQWTGTGFESLYSFDFHSFLEWITTLTKGGAFREETERANEEMSLTMKHSTEHYQEAVFGFCFCCCWVLLGISSRHTYCTTGLNKRLQLDIMDTVLVSHDLNKQTHKQTSFPSQWSG